VVQPKFWLPRGVLVALAAYLDVKLNPKGLEYEREVLLNLLRELN
jgi:hypothetical protein